MHKKIAFITLGCKVNKYDTEAVAQIFKKENYEIVNFKEYADVYVINTCTVTNLSNKKSRQLIRKVKKTNKNSIVIAMGCYAQISPDEVKNIEGVNIVIGTKNRGELLKLVENYINNKINICKVSDVLNEKYFENLSIKKINNMTRGYVKVQDGCNQFCTYCIIPFARGAVRSRNLEDIKKECEILVSNGVKEIVLAGIHVASYGVDLHNVNLITLVSEIDKIKGLKRIRLSSIEPNIITKEFLEKYFSLEKTCNSFHLSLQSGCDKILHDMRRKYSSLEFSQAVDLIREFDTNTSITTDVIVGFPGETEEHFMETKKFVKKIGFAKIHVFPYSKKKGTKAEKMEGHISNNIKEVRCKELRELSNTLEHNFYKKYIGTEIELIIEKVENGLAQGHSKNFIQGIISKDNINVNEIIKVKVVKLEGNKVICE